MRIFRSFLVLIAVGILLFLPMTAGVNSFRTNVRDDRFFTVPVAGSSNVTLSASVYQADTSSVAVTSDLNADNPTAANYVSANRTLLISGLSGSSNRTLTVSYPVDAFPTGGGIASFVDKVPEIWLVVVFAFAPAAILAIFVYRRGD